MKESVFRALCLLAVVAALFTVITTAAAALTQNETGSTEVIAHVESTSESSSSESNVPESSDASKPDGSDDTPVRTGDETSILFIFLPVLLSGIVCIILLKSKKAS